MILFMLMLPSVWSDSPLASWESCRQLGNWHADTFAVIPAQAGIQRPQGVLPPGFGCSVRRGRNPGAASPRSLSSGRPEAGAAGCGRNDGFVLRGDFLPPLVRMTDHRPNSAPYDMRCPIARTLDLVGERWTILILRDLVTGGPRKFQDFERSLTGISPNTLSARLKRLEEAEIVERRFYEQHPPRAEYLLTEKGKELRPVLRTLFDWGQRHTRYRGADK